MKVVHFVTDEKFIDSAVELFESIPWINNTFYLVARGQMTLSFIRNPIVKIIKGKAIQQRILDENFADVIVMHSLGALPNDIIVNIHKRIKLVWLSWGWDLYSNVWPEYKLIKIENRIKDTYSNVLYNMYCGIIALKKFTWHLKNGDVFRNHRTIFRNAIKRIDYYSGVYPIEYDLILEYNRDVFRAKRIDFNYTRKINVDNNVVERYEKNGILVGNSASCLLNHCDVFKRLKSIDLKGCHVFVPLSYGSGKRLYQKRVKKMGYEILGNSFVPVENFMSFTDFCLFLKNCSVAIFNIEQQAASGTIALCIGCGMKVFLPQSSLPYSFYKSIGIKVFSIESDLTEREINDELHLEDRLHNKELIMSYFSFENVLKRVDNSFRKISLDIVNGK